MREVTFGNNGCKCIQNRPHVGEMRTLIIINIAHIGLPNFGVLCPRESPQILKFPVKYFNNDLTPDSLCIHHKIHEKGYSFRVHLIMKLLH